MCISFYVLCIGFYGLKICCNYNYILMTHFMGVICTFYAFITHKVIE